MKKCIACSEHKPLDAFHVMRASPDGRAYKCKPCVNEYSREWRANNPGAHKRWYADNKESRSAAFREWRARNEERNRQRLADWAARNKHRGAAKNAKRRALKVNATPLWADRAAIQAIYAQAEKLTKETGVPHHVDHIVPLRAKIVTGLHWEGNLQVLPGALNISKHNRYWPDMPQ